MRCNLWDVNCTIDLALKCFVFPFKYLVLVFTYFFVTNISFVSSVYLALDNAICHHACWPTWPTAFAVNLSSTSLIFLQLFSERKVYRLSALQVANVVSIVVCLRHSMRSFVVDTVLFDVLIFYVVLSSSPNMEPGGPPLVGCSQQLT